MGFFELACAAGRTDLSRGRRRSECGQKNIVFLSFFFLQQPLPQQRPGDAALPSSRGLIRRKRCGSCCCPGCRCPLFFFGLFLFFVRVCSSRFRARLCLLSKIKEKRGGIELEWHEGGKVVEGNESRSQSEGGGVGGRKT